MVASTDTLVSADDHDVRRAPRLVLAVLALLGLLAALLASPETASARTRAAVVVHHTRAEVQMVRALGKMMNRERAMNGLAPVHLNRYLDLSARRHNLQMARFDQMSHQLPGEAFFADRMTAAGYRWTWAGENIAWNSDISVRGVLQLEQMMYDEVAPNDGHRLNILSSHFQDVGIDVYIDRVNHKVWLTTDFGSH